MIASADEFIRLRTSSDPAEYRRAAHEVAPTTVWLELVAKHPEMRFWVAQNKTVPIEILKILGRDPDPRVRWMVASKRKLDEETLGRLAADPDESVRFAVAQNPNTPDAVLRSMLEDPWSEIVRVVDQRLRR